MSESVLNILGLTSIEYIAKAAERGINSAQAMTRYRSRFREGELSLDQVGNGADPIVRTHQQAGATKFVQRQADGQEIESVILPITGTNGRLRNTLCVSSQVGCAMGCTFCETAQMGLMKNLTAAQIVGQWHAARFELNTPIHNIVFMGMGEPMENIEQVISAIGILTDPNGVAIAPAHVSVSTVGHVVGIARLAQLARRPGFHKLRLAVSINAPNDSIRSRIMPINRSIPMDKLMNAMLTWPTNSRQRILIEYVLIPGVNDALEHAEELCQYLRPLCCTVNVIPYNPRRDSPWPSPSEESVRRFVQRVHDCGQFVKRRQTLGRPVMAACGQLGNPAVRRRRFVNISASVRP